MDYIYILAQVLAIVACIFYTISMQCKKRKTILLLEVHDKKNTPTLVCFYIVLSIIVSLITFKDWIDIIPLAAAILHTLTIIQEKEKRIRYINLSSLVLWIPYYIAFYAWANLATCLCIVVSNVVSIMRYDIKKQKKDK